MGLGLVPKLRNAVSFAKLQDTLLSEAKRELAILEDQHRAAWSVEETRIKDRARTIEEEIITTREAEGKQQAQRLHQAAQLAARADILRAKQAELNAAYQETVAQVLAWDTTEATQLLLGLLALLPKDAKGRIRAGSVHEKLIRGLVDERTLTIDEKTLPDEGGFSYYDSEIELNLTVGYLVRQVFIRHRSEIAQMLF